MIYGTVRETVLAKKKGQFASVVYEKQLKTLKTTTARVEKHTEIMARFGVEYDNIGKVQEKRELGILPSVNQGLPWGEWIEAPYFIEHKGNKYVRLALVPNTKIKSTYYIDGVEATREDCAKLCLASEFREHAESVEVLTIKVENIISIK